MKSTCNPTPLKLNSSTSVKIINVGHFDCLGRGGNYMGPRPWVFPQSPLRLLTNTLDNFKVVSIHHKYNNHSHIKIPRKTNKLAHTNFKLEIWPGL